MAGAVSLPSASERGGAASLVPALEIGGTHVTAALVDPGSGRVQADRRTRRPLDATGSAETILETLVEAARSVAATAPTPALLGVAIPGPFDYARGIGRFRDVAKFESLTGVDVGRALLAGLGGVVSGIAFLNDADAFVLGEWAAGAGAGHDRVAGITLGTGIGSGFVDRGRVVTDDLHVPPEGSVHLLTIEGRPLEDTVSRRAILRSAAATMDDLDAAADVRELASKARAGDARAQAVFDGAFAALGQALAPWLASFDASVLVVGGSMTGSWDVIEPPLVRGLHAAEPGLGLLVRPAAQPEDAALIGAAIHASGVRASRPGSDTGGLPA